jgi:thymidylate synthase ThyX
MAAHELPECRALGRDLHRELEMVIPSFVKRALDEKYGAPAAARMARGRSDLRELAGHGVSSSSARRNGGPAGPSVKLLEHDPDAERKVVAAALFPHTDASWTDIQGDPGAVLEAMLGDRANRRQRTPRALEHAQYAFEIVANFAAYRDLHRHRMLTQDRQLLGTALGFDVHEDLAELGMEGRFRSAIESAAAAHARMERDSGPALAQYIVPLAFRVRWYFRVNLRELYHLCELRTTPQGHPDYRWVAQEMFRQVAEVHPRLARYARFVDMGPGDELERRKSERRIDEKLSAIDRSQ